MGKLAGGVCSFIVTKERKRSTPCGEYVQKSSGLAGNGAVGEGEWHSSRLCLAVASRWGSFILHCVVCVVFVTVASHCSIVERVSEDRQ